MKYNYDYCYYSTHVYACTNVGTVNKAGDTPLSQAYKGGHWEVVKYLAITHHCDTKGSFDVCIITFLCAMAVQL